MKASEAITILEALSPDQEVTIIIGEAKFTKPNGFGPGTPNFPQWVDRSYYWPYGNEITCKTVH